MLHIKYLLRLENELSPQLKQDPLTALAIGSSIVGGLGNMFGQSQANDTNIMLAREAREWQTKENQINRDWQESMWNKQNEYNTPKNQKLLLKQAGFNPFVMSADGSQSAAGSAGSPSMVGAPDFAHVNPINPAGAALDTFGQLMPLIQQQQQIDSNVQLQDANAKKAMADTIINAYEKLGQSGGDKMVSKLFDFGILGEDYNKSPMGRMAEETIRGMVFDNALKELDMEFRNLEIKWYDILSKDQHELNDAQKKQFNELLNKIKAEIKNINANTSLTEAEKEKVLQEKVGVMIENGLKGLDFQNQKELQEEIQEITLESLWKMEDARNYEPFEKQWKYRGQFGQKFPFGAPADSISAETYKKNKQRNSYKRQRRRENKELR